MSNEIDFDVRTVRHQLRRHRITAADVDAHLADLPDDTEHGEETVTRFEGSFESRRKSGNTDEA